MDQQSELAWDAVIGPRIEPAFASEQALLGTVLFSAEDRAAALAELRPEDFQDQVCRGVWRVMQTMAAEGATIDPVSLAERTTKHLHARLDAAWFFRLADLRPTYVDWSGDAKRVKAAAARRRLAELASTIRAKAEGQDHDPQEVAAAAQAELAELAGADSRDTPVSLHDLALQEIDAGETLLGSGDCRFLERGAVLLLSAPSGVGKSHLAAQAAVSWACSRPVFGLAPYGLPLRSLIVQAENPPNDARAIAAGMIRGLALADDEIAAVHERTRQVWLPGCTGDAFLAKVRALLAAWPADIVFVDPLAGFVAGDLTKPETVQAFCRTGLNRIAVQCRCALFVCHHIPKPTAAKDKRKLGAYDHQYAGAGSADLVANWPRAVLSLEAINRGEFLLVAGKRRPPWVDANGQQSWVMGFRHTESMVWETFEPDAAAVKAQKSEAPDASAFSGQVTELFREHGPMCKDLFEDRIKSAGVPRDKGRAVIAMLIEEGVLAQWKGKGNAKIVGLADAKPADAK